MWWVPLAIQAGTSILGGGKAKKATGRAAAQEVERIRLTTGEKIRRRTLEQAQEISSGQAIAGASGTLNTAESGYSKVLADMQAEFTREIDWLNLSGATDIESVASNLRSAKASVTGTQLGGIAQGIMYSGKLAGWW